MVGFIDIVGSDMCPEIPLDISESFGGADFETRSVLTTNNNDDGSKTSYYFPEGTLTLAVPM